MNLREKVIFGLSDEERDTYEQGIREQGKAEGYKLAMEHFKINIIPGEGRSLDDCIKERIAKQEAKKV